MSQRALLKFSEMQKVSKQICYWFHFSALVTEIYPESGSAILPAALVLSLVRK